MCIQGHIAKTDPLYTSLDIFTCVQELKLIPNEPENKTDVVESLQKLKDNDSSLKHLNLNNIKVGCSKQNVRITRGISITHFPYGKMHSKLPPIGHLDF